MSRIKNMVMRRVYAVWFFRQLVRPKVLRLVALGLIFWGLQFYVSFRSVINNVLSLGDWSGGLAFWQSAFLHTETSTQALILAGLAMGGWLLWDVLTFRRPRPLQHSFN